LLFFFCYHGASLGPAPRTALNMLGSRWALLCFLAAAYILLMIS